MRVVSNTSPISNLAIIGRLDLLRRRYEIVFIPSAVADELAALSHPRAAPLIQAARTEGWLRIEHPPAIQPALMSLALDPGEVAAMALARHLTADVLLMDERQGRQAARQLGLTVAGVLGELIHAKHAGWISSVRDEVLRLRLEARFFVDAAVEAYILAQAGE
ncbi:MAG: DUF3368 domain-containing protein [Verrucomicrobiae bacterium]|nr:DUF3368 domain-containing protein [Verrucomicrobiae bacterium]